MEHDIGGHAVPLIGYERVGEIIACRVVWVGNDIDLFGCPNEARRQGIPIKVSHL